MTAVRARRGRHVGSTTAHTAAKHRHMRGRAPRSSDSHAVPGSAVAAAVESKPLKGSVPSAVQRNPLMISSL